MSVDLDTPVQYVKGVGPRRAEMLAKARIETVEDLLKYAPFRYEDRTRFKKIGDLTVNDETVIQAEVVVLGSYTTSMKKVRIFEMIVSDGSGSLEVKFFNQPYLEKVFRKGQQVVLFGTPRVDDYTHNVSLLNPDFEIIDSDPQHSMHTGRIVPIYRRIGQLTTRVLRQIIFRVLEDLGDEIRDPIPSEVARKYSLKGRKVCFREVHFPECPDGPQRNECLDRLQQQRSAAYQRLVFEEFFVFQLGLQLMKRHREAVPKHRQIKVSKKIREIV